MKDKNALLRYFTVDLVIWALVKFSIGLSKVFGDKASTDMFYVWLWQVHF